MHETGLWRHAVRLLPIPLAAIGIEKEFGVAHAREGIEYLDPVMSGHVVDEADLDAGDRRGHCQRLDGSRPRLFDRKHGGSIVGYKSPGSNPPDIREAVGPYR